MNCWNDRRGLTSTEVSIALFSVIVLTIMVYLAIDPAARLREVRNSQRQHDVAEILQLLQTAHIQPSVDSQAVLAAIDSDRATVQLLTHGSADLDCQAVICADVAVVTHDCEVDIRNLTNVTIPTDPQAVTDIETRYYVNRYDDKYTVGSCDPEAGRDGTAPVIWVR